MRRAHRVHLAFRLGWLLNPVRAPVFEGLHPSVTVSREAPGYDVSDSQWAIFFLSFFTICYCKAIVVGWLVWCIG